MIAKALFGIAALFLIAFFPLALVTGEFFKDLELALPGLIIWTTILLLSLRSIRHRSIGKLLSIENGPKRTVKLIITPTELRSEISTPSGTFDPRHVDRYELSGLQEHETGLVTLRLVLTDGQRVRFYSSESKFDMALVLDQLDGTIGERPRELLRDAA